MLSSRCKLEISWFVSSMLLALLSCVILDLPLLTLAIFASAYVLWLLWRMNTLVLWLRAGGNTAGAPQSAGLTDEMVELIHREKQFSRKQTDRYRATVAQFNSLAADLPDATIVLGHEFDIRWANAAAAKLLNIKADTDRGQRIDNLIREPAFREFLHSAQDSEELELNSPLHNERVLAIRKVPTEKRMLVLIAADITQRVHVREMRKAFVADVSHELRTPLTVIRGYLEMLQEDDSISNSAADALEQVAAQSDRMTGIVQELLELSKLEANPLGETEGETVNISAMVRTMIKALQKNAPHHAFTLDMDESLALLGSERELYSVCNNLLTNAIRYTEAGTQIEVTWRLQADGSALYQVSDNGPGIEARHLSRLSERFYRVDLGRSREHGGTGLGLAIVKHAVQRHGGELEIDSTPGLGSCFGARFPINRVIAVAHAANH